MNEHPFNLQGDEYWTKPFKNDRALAERTIFQSQAGLFIDGPPVVDLAVRNTIPIPVFSCLSQKDALAVPLKRYAYLVATRLEDRQTFTGFAVPRDKPLPQAPPGAQADESSMVTDNLLPDLKRQVGLGDDPGTYQVVLLLRERASNGVQIGVSKSGGYADPEVAKFIEKQPLPAPAPVTPAPGTPLPSYRRSDASPELPQTAGIAISAPRVSVLRQGAQVAIAGAFKVPLLKREMTGASPGGQEATAIVPITLVAFSSDPGRFGPFVMKMRVPSYDAIAAADPVGTGYFAIDLLGLPGVQPKAATFFVYAFLGEWMSGPAHVGLVTPDMLPK
ncbi:MAG: hypothetical protein JXP73_01280 [Deltaproteobacteria bacterium]|nr:hypothetical protein [Deltaproteobacteria bacterium]